jgi:hypothetical protein
LRTSAFPAFINMVHETRLLRLSASKAHLPIAFLANGLFDKRGRRRDRRFHHGILTYLSGMRQIGQPCLTWASGPRPARASMSRAVLRRSVTARIAMKSSFITGEKAERHSQKRTTPPERNMIARRRWFGCRALKIPQRNSVCMGHVKVQ